MIRHLCAGLVSLAMVLAPAARAADASPRGNVDALLELSGLSLVIQNIPDNIADGIDNQDLFDLSDLSADDIDILKQVLTGAFDPPTVRRDVAAQFQRDYDAGRVTALLTQLRTPLARRVTALERRANSPEAQSDYQDFVAELALHAPDPRRVALMKRLDRLSHSTDITVLIQIEIAKTIAEGVTTFDPQREPLTDAQVNGLVQELQQRLNPAIRNHILVWSLYAYRSLSNADIERYIAMYDDRNMQWFLKVTSGALIGAMRRAAARADRGITTLRNAQPI